MRNVRFTLVAVSIASIAFAGCISDDAALDDSEGPGRTSAPSPVRYDWGHEGCQVIIAIFPAEAADVQPHLPEGFTIQPFKDALGLPLPMDAPNADGNFGAEIMACTDGSYGSYFAGVTVPEGFERDVDMHFVKWDVAISDAQLVSALVEAGVPAVSAEAAFMLYQGAGTLTAAVNGQLSFGENAEFFDAVGAAPNDEFPTGSFVEYTETANGFVEWQAAFTFERSGLGSVNYTPATGSLAEDVLGTQAVGAGFIGDMDLHDAWVELPGDGL